jgi:hypothetical protein
MSSIDFDHIYDPTGGSQLQNLLIKLEFYSQVAKIPSSSAGTTLQARKKMRVLHITSHYQGQECCREGRN